MFSKITDAGFEVADLTDELRALFHFKSQTTGPVVRWMTWAQEQS